jgi:signal transduction histidine kinase
LAATARRVAAGDLGARATVNGRDEVAQAATAFNEMAAQLQTAAEERAEVEQLRRDLIAWVSHDLRTPLTSVRAMVEALHDGVVEDEETVQRYYRTIRADIVALNDLIDDLFEMAQLDAHSQSLNVAPHALSDLISDAVASFQALAEREAIAISHQVDPAVDPTPLDAAKIGRVLNNLIANALQHTPPEGEIEITAERVGAEIHVTVTDSGPGFAEESLPRVFEQFYRGEQSRSRATGGAGLGLAIAHAIVDAHNGRMWAENVPEGGACVGFSLPG